MICFELIQQRDDWMSLIVVRGSRCVTLLVNSLTSPDCLQLAYQLDLADSAVYGICIESMQ